MRALSEVGSSLVIQSPPWFSLALIAAGVALMFVPFVVRPPRPWRLGALLGTMVLVYAGWTFFASTATFESRGFHVQGRFGDEERVGWLQVSGVQPGENALLVQLRSGGEVEIDLSGLSAAEVARVVAYARERLKR